MSLQEIKVTRYPWQPGTPDQIKGDCTVTARRALDEHELWAQQLLLGDGVTPKRRTCRWLRVCALLGGVWLLLTLVLR